MIKDIFSLKEIAEWQLNIEESSVELPSIQRGFVWNPKQVEDLWDSLLRGYPIGSFLFSRTGDKLYLMDGQQRATSIFLGHFNPFNQNETAKPWSIKESLPIIWIDIKPKNKPTSSKYLIRITTKSHPWGYQAISNNVKLSVPDRRKALKKFSDNAENKLGYTSFKNTNVFPYDASYPLPLSFFLESKNIEEVIKMAENYLPDNLSTKEGGFDNKNTFINLLKNELIIELTEIFEKIKNVREIKIKSNIIEDKVLNEENESEDPTLFVRINSSGTKLTGDDLIYSIYKALFPDTKKLIEDVGINFIAPTQVISLVCRIVASKLNNNIYIKKMNVLDFQQKIKDEAFKEELKNLIESEEIKRLFEQAINILSCENNSLFQDKVPAVIVKVFIKGNQDLFLFLIYWLHKHKKKLTPQTELKIAAKLLSFSWFGFNNISRLWKEKINNELFWEEPLNELMEWKIKERLNTLIKPELLRKYYSQLEILDKKHKTSFLEKGVGEEIIQYFKIIKSQDLELNVNEYFTEFIQNVQRNKQLLLFAQRKYINEAFKDYSQMGTIDDTNVPWDWDHIYPTSWVQNKHIDPRIRDWNNTIGNFRAISLEQNRSRNNKQSPQAISDIEERNYSFIKENDWQYWQKIDAKIERKMEQDKADNYYLAVTNRMVNIYEKFWNDLRINEIIKETEKD